MTGAIQISGVASGLDTKAIIDALMRVETQGLTRLQAQRDLVAQRQSALRDIRTRLVTLQQRAFSLTLLSTVNSKAARVADSTILAASAGGTAANGPFTVTVKQLATATQATSVSAVGSAIDPNGPLQTAGFSTTPTSGTFTINGVAISVDVTAQSLADVVNAINASGAGVTASLVADRSGRADNRLQLTAANGQTVQLGSRTDTSNFLSVVRVLGAAPTSAQTGGTLGIGAETPGGDAVVTAIDTSGARRTDRYSFSYNAATNTLTLTRASDGATATAAVLGLAAGATATYEFTTLGVKVSVQGLAASGESADDLGAFFQGQTIETTALVQSQGNLGVTLASTPLSAARLATPLTATEGSFSINGKVISWKDTDTLNQVISRINASGAGVTAAYDSIRDALVLTAKTTGSQLLNLSDVSGNFLTAMNLTAPGAQTAGQNAIYSIDTVAGGADLASATNTVSNIVPGVTLTFQQVGTTQVTISQDTGTTASAMQAFIDQFNSTMSLINEKLQYDPATQTAGLLFGDGGLRIVSSRLRALLISAAPNAQPSDRYQSLMGVGLSFGKVGSKVGSTNDLTLDQDRLQKALIDDPDQAGQVIRDIFGQINSYLNGLVSTTGIFRTRDTAANEELRRIDRQIIDFQRHLEDRRAILEQKFADLESTLASLQQQQSALVQQLAALQRG